ncbi:DUF3857 domain-containing transglutaminase family protein [Pseudoduganella armeniaca]|uniref:DUF3857 domain-containing protein n=1 Tax=Pseudoduganella armeniaca TaxID=2072590 RepID=A0A2R4C9Q7_9BURK|nr:DUF3857 and transglutaminase domain-containing protein [Pseudoduganella armeniaca]AVR96369.1 hypothetical protein C9I28_12140 [Pseudoduganella armeniaca]
MIIPFILLSRIVARWLLVFPSWKYFSRFCGGHFLLLAGPLIINTNSAIAAQQPADYISGVTYERLRVDYDINADGTYTKTWEAVRRIDTDSGAQKESTYSIYYKDSLEEVRISHAYVIDEAGQRTDVGQDAILRQLPKASPETATFTDVHSVAVVFPNVRPGARLYLKYHLVRLRPDFAGVFSVIDWYSIHAKRLDYQYTFKAPVALGLQVQATDMEVEKTRAGKVDIWRARGGVTSPVAPERGSIAAINYSPRIVASSLASHAEFAKRYAALNLDAAEPPAEVAALAERLTKGVVDRRAQASTLYRWVATNIRYVGVQVGAGSWQARPAAQVLRNGYGDCKGHVALLRMLLKAKGIASDGVLLNMGSEWWEAAPAAPQAYNHIIVFIPELDVFLDSTQKDAPFGVLTPDVAGKNGLLVDGATRIRIAPIASTGYVNVSTSQHLTLRDDGSIAGTSTITHRGISAMLNRASFAAIKQVPDVEVVKAILQQDGERGTGTIARPQIDSLSESSETRVDFELAAKSMSRPHGDLATTRGLLFGGIGSFVRAALGPEKRLDYPCPPVVYSENTAVSLHAGMTLSRLPQDVVLEPTDAVPIAYRSQYRISGNSLTIARTLRVTPSGPVCKASVYNDSIPVIRRIEQDINSVIAYQWSAKPEAHTGQSSYGGQ